jgi:hypothetical protein
MKIKHLLQNSNLYSKDFLLLHLDKNPIIMKLIINELAQFNTFSNLLQKQQKANTKQRYRLVICATYFLL